MIRENILYMVSFGKQIRDEQLTIRMTSNNKDE